MIIQWRLFVVTITNIIKAKGEMQLCFRRIFIRFTFDISNTNELWENI